MNHEKLKKTNTSQFVGKSQSMNHLTLEAKEPPREICGWTLDFGARKMMEKVRTIS